MKRILKSALVFSLGLLLANGAVAQGAEGGGNDVKPIRVGVKFGLPQLAGLNLEYLTPLLDNRLSGSLDISYIPISGADVDLTVFYIGGGANYYFKNTGKGFYGGLNYGRLGMSFTKNNLISEIGTAGLPPGISGGKAEASAGVGFLQILLGVKLGGTFYLRPEIGYGFASADDKVTTTVTFETITGPITQVQSVEIPSISGGGFTGNIGFGLAF